MLFNTILVAALASVAAASPLTARSTQNGNFCMEGNNQVWSLKQNSDIKNQGDLTKHPVWDKKFNNACACADAIKAAPGPRAALFVWNSVTKGCYPKGILDDQPDAEVDDSLLLPQVTVVTTGGGKTYLEGNDDTFNIYQNALCLPLNMGPDTPALKEACQAMINFNDYTYDYAVFTVHHAFIATCALCKYETAAGQVAGWAAYQTI
ncbi:hypothetical protein HDU87_006096 [Geranomyces variabilis]|uniref:Uncharacterized protein n=1 Tax=Geranomyces variabilis TaxID=109894 RepID=A0AAD5XLC3_9FUNG|nr:hypothetical protein HDU87_006096 [Geranomyces variabilis]